MLRQAVERATSLRRRVCFNGHPPLGVNATGDAPDDIDALAELVFQWAPTLGGECYKAAIVSMYLLGFDAAFQWAPTLGGECYGIVYLITPPLCQGVDALLNNSKRL